MAKVILEQKLESVGRLTDFELDSAAYDVPTDGQASANAREAIKRLYKDDLLAPHKPKKLTPDLVEKADLILVATRRMKVGLPEGKTWNLKEYAGESGDVADPYGGDVDVYLECASEISRALDEILPKLN